MSKQAGREYPEKGGNTRETGENSRGKVLSTGHIVCFLRTRLSRNGEAEMRNSESKQKRTNFPTGEDLGRVRRDFQGQAEK